MSRTNYSSGAPLEEVFGYSRMVKVGNMVLIGEQLQYNLMAVYTAREVLTSKQNIFLKNKLNY